MYTARQNYAWGHQLFQIIKKTFLLEIDALENLGMDSRRYERRFGFDKIHDVHKFEIASRG